MLNRLFFSLFVGAVLVLSFLAGGLATYYRLPPYELLDNAIEAVKAEYKRDTLVTTAIRDSTVVKKNVVQVTDTPESLKGYTLYTTSPTQKYARAYLIDMEGNTVHEWGLPYSEFPTPVRTHKRLPDKVVYWCDAQLFPNGDLLATYYGSGDTPYGYGLVKLDKDSHVIWGYGEHVNHRFDVTENGNIITLIHDITSPPSFDDIDFRNKSIFTDSVTLLTPQGEEFGRISLLDALADSEYQDALKQRVARKIKKGDILHPNSVDALPSSMAAAFPMFKPGQILVSLRNMHAIVVVDPESKKVVWLARGMWRAQHYAQFVDDGTIMLFDNRGTKKRVSRILKYNPTTEETEIVFQGGKNNAFFSAVSGMQQPLPNGNMLITETTRGRMLEINKDKEIVWKFIDPFHPRGKRRPADIVTGKRYTVAELPFLKDAAAVTNEE